LIFNAPNQMGSFTPPGQSILGFGYADRDSTERTYAGYTNFVNSELGVLSQSDSTGTTSFTRDPSGGLIAERAPSGTYYYLFDTHGSVVAVTYNAGVVYDSYVYDPYGNLTTAMGTCPTRGCTPVATWTPTRASTSSAPGTTTPPPGASLGLPRCHWVRRCDWRQLRCRRWWNYRLRHRCFGHWRSWMRPPLASGHR